MTGKYYLFIYVVMLLFVITFYCFLPKKNKRKRYILLAFEDNMFESPVCYDREKQELYKINPVSIEFQISVLPKEIHRKSFLMLVKNLKRRKVKYVQIFHDELPVVIDGNNY